MQSHAWGGGEGGLEWRYTEVAIQFTERYSICSSGNDKSSSWQCKIIEGVSVPDLS